MIKTRIKREDLRSIRRGAVVSFVVSDARKLASVAPTASYLRKNEDMQFKILYRDNEAKVITIQRVK